MLIQVITGQETFEAKLLGGGSVSVTVLVRDPEGGDDVPIHTAERERRFCITQVGSQEWLNADAGNANHGRWVITRYQVEPGTFLQVVIGRKLYGDFIKKFYRFYIHVREGAASRALSIPFTEHQNASLRSGRIEGRFDILRHDQLGKLGITVPPAVERNFKIDDFSEIFSDRVLEKESSPLIIPSVETVATDKGREVKIVRATPRRKLNI